MSTSMTGQPAYRVLDTVDEAADSETAEWIRHTVGRAKQDFPELHGTVVTVGRIPDSDFAYARAFVTNNIIMLPADHRTPWDTVYHELGHLAIQHLAADGDDVPTTSEEFCSLFSVARMPVERIERSDIDYLGEPSVPKAEWPDICERALAYREEHHDYIQQAKRWLGI